MVLSLRGCGRRPASCAARWRARALAGSPNREGEWSALETLTQLRDVVVHVYELRIRRLLYEAAPLFADFDEESYRRASLTRGEATGDLLDTIIAEHEQLARLLQTLPDAECVGSNVDAFSLKTTQEAFLLHIKSTFIQHLFSDWG